MKILRLPAQDDTSLLEGRPFVGGAPRAGACRLRPTAARPWRHWRL